MEMLLSVGAIAALNLIIVWIKLDSRKYLNAIADISAFVIFVSFSGNTLGGLVIATIASLLVSIFLFVSPPKFIRGT